MAALYFCIYNYMILRSAAEDTLLLRAGHLFLRNSNRFLRASLGAG